MTITCKSVARSFIFLLNENFSLKFLANENIELKLVRDSDNSNFSEAIVVEALRLIVANDKVRISFFLFVSVVLMSFL